MWESSIATLARRADDAHVRCNAIQDLGNTCWTFLSSRAVYNNKLNTQVVIDSLKRFGIDATTSGRNDILVGTHKVSGSAYKLSGSRACHHGTLLLNVDLARLGRYLNPNKEKLKVSSTIVYYRDRERDHCLTMLPLRCHRVRVWLAS